MTTQAESQPWWLSPLDAAILDVSAPWRTPQLATVDAHGRPQVRTVVLRDVQQTDGVVLMVHTHAAAMKVSDILHTPDVALCFWDPSTQCQLRLSGTAQVQTQTTVADAVWAEMPDYRQRLYDVDGRPGDALSDPMPCVTGRAAFAILEILVVRADSLDLSTKPHSRIKWTYEAAHGWLGVPVQP